MRFDNARWRRRCATALALWTLAFPALRAAEIEPTPANRIAADTPGWRDLIAAFQRQPDTVAEFEERRVFPFRSEPLLLKGEVRVSRARGLSLRYTQPEERTIIVDRQGMLIRDASGQKAPPDPRAGAANAALLHVLRFDFAALEKDFELHGRRGDAAAWAIVLVPRADAMRRALGNIHVAGEGAAVQRIELRRSAKQRIEIQIFATRSPVTFSTEELARYFR